MDLIVSHMSAVDFWRIVYPSNRVPSAAPNSCEFENLATLDDDVWTLAPEWVTEKFLAFERGTLHTLVFSRNDRRDSSTHQAHVWSGPIPLGSFYSFGGGVFVASPAFLMLQMATKLTRFQLVAYACELCGTYSFNPSVKRGFLPREAPLVSLATLMTYAEIACEIGARNAQKMRDALQIAFENCASPMEAVCALLLAVPLRQGGYGLPRPVMNHPVPLDAEARKLYSVRECKVDACWLGLHLGLEFLGGEDHEGRKAMRSDRARINALVEMGYRIIEITSCEVYNAQAFERIAVRLAKLLSRRFTMCV